jgi:O-antigen ligase
MNDSVASVASCEAPKTPGITEKLFAIAVLLYSTGAFLPFLQPGRDPDSGVWMGTLVTNVLWSLTYCISFFLLLRNFQSPFASVKRNWILLALLGLATTSILWSDVPVLSMLRCVALYGTTVISLYFSRRYGTPEFLILCAWALAIAGCCSVLMVIFVPRYGIGTGEFQGDWLGIYGQKNNLGAAMSVGFLVSILLYRFIRPRRYRYLLLSVFTLALVFLSDSTTSLVICVALPLVLWMTRMVLVPSSRRKYLRIGIAVLATGIASGVAFNFEWVTNAIGRDPTLTGRTVLWGLVYEAIQERPLLGYGYEAFWQDGNGLAGDIWKNIGLNLFYSHDGFLEVWLGLGLVGLMVFTACLVSLVVRSLHLVRKRFCLNTVWPWLFLSYMILSNLTEVSYMKSNTLPWILFSILVLSWSEDLKRIIPKFVKM